MSKFSVRAARVWKSGTNELLGWLPFVFGPGPNDGFPSNLCCAFAGMDPALRLPEIIYPTAEEAMDAYEQQPPASQVDFLKHVGWLGLNHEQRCAVEDGDLLHVCPDVLIRIYHDSQLIEEPELEDNPFHG